jgi:macrolide transport system ATP-binding/permease protein
MALIDLRGIGKYYGGEDGSPLAEVLRGIDLEIDAGEFVAIVGASGSGKSTLMHILGCLDRPTSGQYLFNGVDVTTLNNDQLAGLRRETFGFVFQAYHLIPTESARENVEVPALYAGVSNAARQARATELLRHLGLADRLDKYPSQLSGGQQQRVSIARALMNGGQVILADEPTGALDSETGEGVMTLLGDLAASGHTVILITHDHQLAERAQRIIQIQDGRIVGDRPTAYKGGSNKPVGDRKHDNRAWSKPNSDDRSRLPREELRDAWRVLQRNHARTLLTILGIIIGVASVIVMLAVGEGTKREVMAQLNAMGPNMLHVGSTIPTTGGPRGVITEADLDAIARLPAVRRSMPMLRDTTLVRRGAINRNYEIRATTAVLPKMNRWPLAQGRFYTEEEDRNVAPVVVLGHLAYQRFFPDKSDPLGEQILIKNAPYQIIGVMSEKGAESGYNNHDERLYVPRRTGMVRVFPERRNETYLIVEVVSSDLLQHAEQRLQALLLERHGVDDFWVNNAAARHQAELTTRNNMTLMLALIAAISLLVGGIGVMNVMLMSVRERVREIGIRMASGARQRDILRQFITEAALVSLLGSVIGATSSQIIIVILALTGVPVAFSISPVVGAMICAVTTGILFGLMPARQAARLDPVVALAGE